MSKCISTSHMLFLWHEFTFLICRLQFMTVDNLGNTVFYAYRIDLNHEIISITPSNNLHRDIKFNVTNTIFLISFLYSGFLVHTILMASFHIKYNWHTLNKVGLVLEQKIGSGVISPSYILISINRNSTHGT